MKNLTFNDSEEVKQEEDEPVVTSLLDTVGLEANTETKIDAQIHESDVDEEMLRKQRIKDQINRKQRGLDFIKLNKSVVYSNVK